MTECLNAALIYCNAYEFAYRLKSVQEGSDLVGGTG